MQEAISSLKEEIASLRDRPTQEEGEICEEDKATLKEELTKAIIATIEVKTKDIEERMEAKQEGWVEVVKKNIRKETDIVHTTIEEEKLRRSQKLNTRVTGIKETENLPEEDGKALCTTLGYEEEDHPPFTKAWRAGKDNTKEKALILQFPTEEAKTTFMKKKAILRGIKEGPTISFLSAPSRPPSPTPSRPLPAPPAPSRPPSPAPPPPSRPPFPAPPPPLRPLPAPPAPLHPHCLLPSPPCSLRSPSPTPPCPLRPPPQPFAHIYTHYYYTLSYTFIQFCTLTIHLFVCVCARLMLMLCQMPLVLVLFLT